MRQHGDHDEVDEVFADDDEEEDNEDTSEGGGLGFHILDVDKESPGSDIKPLLEKKQSRKRRLFKFPLDSPQTPAGNWQSLDVYQSLANVTRHPSMIMEVS